MNSQSRAVAIVTMLALVIVVGTVMYAQKSNARLAADVSEPGAKVEVGGARP